MRSHTPAIVVPEDLTGLLLHACCAPCSAAIVEWLTAHGIRPTVFYFNPNIFPEEEYLIRKRESQRHCASLGITWIDGDYDHGSWLGDVAGLECEPERGRRCLRCFTTRLTETARRAAALGFSHFATTLASSRWKDINQINDAGLEAQKAVGNQSVFWAQNWRRGGLQQRRAELLRQFNFYNQRYCGCEFSMPPEPADTNELPNTDNT